MRQAEGPNPSRDFRAQTADSRAIIARLNGGAASVMEQNELAGLFTHPSKVVAGSAMSAAARAGRVDMIPDFISKLQSPNQTDRLFAATAMCHFCPSIISALTQTHPSSIAALKQCALKDPTNSEYAHLLARMGSGCAHLCDLLKAFQDDPCLNTPLLLGPLLAAFQNQPKSAEVLDYLNEQEAIHPKGSQLTKVFHLAAILGQTSQLTNDREESWLHLSSSGQTAESSPSSSAGVQAWVRRLLARWPFTF